MTITTGQGETPVYEGDGWLLEGLDVSSFRLVNINADPKSFGVTYPGSCGTQRVPVVSRFRYSNSSNETLSGSLCDEGSTLTAYVDVYADPPERTTIVCQKLFSFETDCRREP
jgi:hypothetical protein